MKKTSLRKPKRLLSVLLVIVIVLGPISVFASEDATNLSDDQELSHDTDVITESEKTDESEEAKIQEEVTQLYADGEQSVSSEAQAVLNQIKALVESIGKTVNITLDHKSAITTVWSAYNVLNEEQKNEVKTATGFLSSQTAYRDLESFYWTLQALNSVTNTKSTVYKAAGFYTKEGNAITSTTDNGASNSSRGREWQVNKIMSVNKTVTAVISVDSASFDYIRCNGVKASKNTDSASGRSEFTIPVVAGGKTNVALYISAYSTSMKGEIAYKLTYSVGNTTTPAEAVQITEKKYPSTSVTEEDVSGKLFAAKADSPDANYSMFNISKATAVKVGDTIYATIYVNPTSAGAFTYDYMYMGNIPSFEEACRNNITKGTTLEGVKGNETTVDESSKQKYQFTLPAGAAGTVVPFCTLKANGEINSSELVLNIPAISTAPGSSDSGDGKGEEDGDKDKTPIANSYPIHDGLTDAGITVIKKSDSEPYKMFTITKSNMIDLNSKVLVHLETKNVSYDRIYFGTKNDATKEPIIKGTELASGGWEFAFEIPKSYIGTTKDVVIGKPDGSWYTSNDLQMQISDTVNSGKEKTNAGVKILAGGSEVEQMFVVSESSAIKAGDSIVVTVKGTRNKNGTGDVFVDRLYLGTKDDKTKTPVIGGAVADVEGKKVSTFSFKVPKDKEGTWIPVVAGLNNGTWDTTQNYFVYIPQFDRAFDANYYKDGTYDIYGNAWSSLSRDNNRSFPVDSESTLTVKGNKILIKFVTRTSSFDKLYFGTLTDSATMDSKAIEAKEYAPIGMNYKYYDIELDKSVLGKPIPFVRHSKTSKAWDTLQDYLNFSYYLPLITEDEKDDGDSNPSTPGKIPKDGTYTTTAETGATMFKVVGVTLYVKNGKMSADITLSGTGYDYLYPGTKAQAEATGASNYIPFKDIGGKYVYRVPVSALDTELNFASHSIKNNAWYDRTITISSSDLVKVDEEKVPDSGNYKAKVSITGNTYPLVNNVLAVSGVQMTAKLVFQGTGYDYLYYGTATEAQAALQNLIKLAPSPNSVNIYAAPGGTLYIPTINAQGDSEFVVPIAELDKNLGFVAHKSGDGGWDNLTLNFKSEGLTNTGETLNTETPENNQNDGNEGLTNEADIQNMINRTQKGEVKDGTYKPSFGYTGGTGRVTISCPKVVVSGGKALATIVFGSTHFTWVSVGGTKHYNENKGGNSTFTIPVNLNGTTTISAETTAMSSPHVIDYVLYVYVDGTNVSHIKTAPHKDDEDEKAEELDKEEDEWGQFDSVQSKNADGENAGGAVSATIDPAAISKYPLIVGIIAVIIVIAIVGVAISKRKNINKE